MLKAVPLRNKGGGEECTMNLTSFEMGMELSTQPISVKLICSHYERQ